MCVRTILQTQYFVYASKLIEIRENIPKEKETMVNEGDALKYFATMEKSKYACRLISRFWSLVFQGGHVWWRIVDGILINKHLNCWCHLSCTILYAQWLND